MNTHLDAPSQKRQNNAMICHSKSFYVFLYQIILLPFILIHVLCIFIVLYYDQQKHNYI